MNDLIMQLQQFHDIGLVFLGFFLSIFLTLYLYNIRPKLLIDSVEKINSVLEVKVVNIGKHHAYNLNIEVCSFFESKTFHFKADKDAFLTLPPKKDSFVTNEEYYRIFKIREFANSATYYGISYEDVINMLANNERTMRIRVRIIAYHEITGFGKLFEQKFEWQNESFIKV